MQKKKKSLHQDGYGIDRSSRRHFARPTDMPVSKSIPISCGSVVKPVKEDVAVKARCD